MNALYQAGEGPLTSCYQLANPVRQVWHRGFGLLSDQTCATPRRTVAVHGWSWSNARSKGD
jgi:hypothetical protein